MNWTSMKVKQCNACIHKDICKHVDEINKFLSYETASFVYTAVTCDKFLSEGAYNHMVKSVSECTEKIMNTLGIKYIEDPVSSAQALNLVTDEICEKVNSRKRKRLLKEVKE